jgi:hypothetical protein
MGGARADYIDYEKMWGLPFYPCFMKRSKHVGRKNSVLGWPGKKI